MSSIFAALLRITAIVALVCALVWHLSSDDQRRRLLVAFGIADSLELAELTGLSLVGPGFEWELLAPVPLAPIRFIRPESSPMPTRQPDRPMDAVHGRGLAHGDNPCRAGAAANPSRSPPSRALHRWVDASGRVVFSDHAPPGANAQVIANPVQIGVGRFSADYDYAGLVPPSGFQQQLEIDLDGVFHFLADDLGLRDVEPVHVALRIVNGQQHFVQAAAGTGLDLSSTSGFYRFSDNQAVVRWLGDAGTRAVARHEIAHLALGNWLGQVPLWLNEGLAEVVERMQFQQSFATAAAPARDLDGLRRLQRAGGLPALPVFLAGDREDWNRWGNDLAYPYAWSLVHFLLQEPSRQRGVSDLLNALAQHRCLGFDHVDALDRGYAGGLAALERDWQRWLLGNQAAAMQF